MMEKNVVSHDFQSAASNSGLYSTKRRNFDFDGFVFENSDASCFIDMISVTGCVPDKNLFEFKSLLSSDNKIQDLGFGRLPSMEDFRILIHEYSNIHTNTYSNSGVYVEFNQRRIKPDYHLKIEFNPTKIGVTQWDKIKSLLKLCVDLSVSRVDIAFDFFEDLSKMIVIDRSSRRKRVDYYINNGSYKTGSAFGDRSADLFLRIYDKYLEVSKKLGKNNGEEDEEILNDLNKCNDNQWFRVEFELKKKDRAVKNFDSIESKIKNSFSMYFDDYLNDEFSVEERATLKFLKEFPDEFSNLSERKKVKYKKLRLSEQAIERDIQNELNQRWDSRKKILKKQINDLLGLGKMSTFL